MTYLQRCLVVTWLVPRETAAVSAPHVLGDNGQSGTSLRCRFTDHDEATYYIGWGACVFSCNGLMPSALLEAGGGTNTEIRLCQYTKLTLEKNISFSRRRSRYAGDPPMMI